MHAESSSLLHKFLHTESINGDAPSCGTGRDSRSDVELLLHIRFRRSKVGFQTEASDLDDDVLFKLAAST